jgi:hypothetical protein
MKYLFAAPPSRVFVHIPASARIWLNESASCREGGQWENVLRSVFPNRETLKKWVKPQKAKVFPEKERSGG